nr:NAD-binding protein [Desulfobacterales bacterium]
VYNRNADRLKRFETRQRHVEDTPIDPGAAEIAVFGMGRIGTSTYDTMVEHYGDVVIGVDFAHDTVEVHRAAGRNVILGDPTDRDFWERTAPDGQESEDKIKMVLLAMPKHAASLAAAKFLRSYGYKDLIVTTAHYEDEIPELEEAGADRAFDFRTEVGIGLAEQAQELLIERVLIEQRDS